MNQKGFVPILIVILVAAAALGGYFIYQNQSKQLKPIPSPPTGSKEQFKLSPLSYKFYDGMFLELVDYPDEMSSLSEDSLKDTTCSEKFDVNSDGFEFERIEGIPNQILKELLLREVAAFILCDTGDSYILVYENWGGGGGNRNTAHITLTNKQVYSFSDIVELPREGPYFGCSAPLAITKNNILYLKCEGSDVGYSSSLYKVDLIKKSRESLIRCQGEYKNENDYLEECTDANQRKIFFRIS